MADSGTPQPADRWHAHFEEEAAFATLNTPAFNAPQSLRLEDGSTYTAEYEEIMDTTMKEDDGDDESGPGVPIVALALTTALEGTGTSAGDGVTQVTCPLAMMLSCQLNQAEVLTDGDDVKVASSPTTTAVEQTGGGNVFVAGDIAVFTTVDYGIVGRIVASVIGTDMTLTLALPQAPAVGSIIYGTNNLYIKTSHAGLATPTLQCRIQDPLQLMSFNLLGLGGNGVTLDTAARNAQKMLALSYIGAAFGRNVASAITQPTGNRPRSSVKRQVWIGPVGPAAAMTRLGPFDYSFKTNHDTMEDPNDDPAFANGGYNYITDIEFQLELHVNATPIVAANYFAQWEDSTGNAMQVFIQHGTTAGRLFMIGLESLILKKPTINKQGKRWSIVLPFKCLTGKSGNFGTIALG